MLVWVNNHNITGTNTTRKMNFTITAIDISLSDLATQTYTIAEKDLPVLYEGTNITKPDFFDFKPSYSLKFTNGSDYPHWITTFAPDLENAQLPVQMVIFTDVKEDTGRFKLELIFSSGFEKFKDGQD